MRSDCHIHARGDEKGEDILRAMDRAGLDLICIISPPPESFMQNTPGQVRKASDRKRLGGIARMISADPGRIRGFYWLEPRAKDAVQQVQRAKADCGCTGIKLIPDHWYPYEERFFPVYEKIQSLEMPVLFHTGILWGNADSSRFCRPAYCEVMQLFPNIRFMMAHIAWPWTDECIAVADRFKTMARIKDGHDPVLMRDAALRHVNLHKRELEVDVRCKVDLTPGTPAVYRSDVLRLCYEALGADMLVFGTDSGGADELSGVRAHQERDERIFRDEIGLSQRDIDRIFGTNLLQALGIS